MWQQSLSREGQLYQRFWIVFMCMSQWVHRGWHELYRYYRFFVLSPPTCIQHGWRKWLARCLTPIKPGWSGSGLTVHGWPPREILVWILKGLCHRLRIFSAHNILTSNNVRNYEEMLHVLCVMLGSITTGMMHTNDFELNLLRYTNWNRWRNLFN